MEHAAPQGKHHPNNPRVRRRVVRLSPAEDYDRKADQPTHAFHDGHYHHDAEREVLLDLDSEESLSGEDFWKAEKPPHYGG
ncbi:hypothetical protein GP475_03870 [Corynebacterium poyangense]|uniref:Uncharacterized protein n=1 Tax=Corynebacterium poyangense TaxID=2684405 RepID=A0A7H0SMV4_9CORY|nr:hypothetical protein [Corynebacterium poyangense]QNQ89879.1 hypothetical protein GP475_03870 [Corynebacterium poyangense]